MANPRYPCRTCGTWVCAACGWKRPGASVVYEDHTCGKCPSREGALTPTLHTERMWWRHNDGDLPAPVSYGALPEPELRAASAGPEFYRGFRVPKTGPYARTDIASWKRGVDDVLDSQCST